MASTSHFSLFSPYFRARTPERQQELDDCLMRNVARAEIQHIVLFVDDGHQPPLRHPKLEVLSVSTRLTYRHWVEVSRSRTGHSISVLANSDIYFDETLPLLASCLQGPKSFVALSRYERDGDTLVPHPRPAWSQDVWALRNAAEVSASLLARLDIPLGVPRCDNKVAYLFAIHGWSVFNPQRYVRSVHVHETQQRNYDKKADLTVLGAVAYVPPGETLTSPSRLEVDVWALNTPAIAAVRLNRSLDNWAAERAAASPPQPSIPDALSTEPGGPPSPQPGTAAATAVTLEQRQRFTSRGQRVFDHLHRHAVYRLDDKLLALDWLDPSAARVLPVAALGATPGGGLPAALALALFVPPVIDIAPLVVSDRPSHAADCQFWQYPAATEKQALDNHRHLPPGSNVDTAQRTVSTYLGLPWATYIDKKQFPPEVLQHVAPRLQGLAALARALGYRLQVHTVCQQIHWRRLMEQFRALHVTDLHVSHAVKGLDAAAEGWRLRVHSWPLIAPNVEDPARSAGLEPGKPVAHKRWLASFIGAHMPHYRSEVRLRLLEVARASGRSDVLVDLGSEWHFNKVVYKEQVQHQALSTSERQAHDDATLRYNQVISDSVFSLCPEGAGPNTLRIWESLAVGAIPVIIAEDWEPPSPRRPDEPALAECSLFVTQSELPTLFDRLQSIPPERVRQMQADCIRLYGCIRQRVAFQATVDHPHSAEAAVQA